MTYSLGVLGIGFPVFFNTVLIMGRQDRQIVPMLIEVVFRNSRFYGTLRMMYQRI